MSFALSYQCQWHVLKKCHINLYTNIVSLSFAVSLMVALGNLPL